MKKQAFFAFIISLALTACNQNKSANQIPVEGAAIDSTAIAQDTSQEKSLENSYEYAQVVVVNPKLVYDVRAYNGPPNYGKYCIIRRGANNKPDTVVVGKRNWIIVNAFTADLNNNGKPEVYIITQSADSALAENIIAFEFDDKGKATDIKVHFEPEKVWDYHGRDSIYLDPKKHIGRIFPLYDKNNKPTAWMRIGYRLIDHDLLHFSAEMIKHY